jgi:hypothetical protein
MSFSFCGSSDDAVSGVIGVVRQQAADHFGDDDVPEGVVPDRDAGLDVSWGAATLHPELCGQPGTFFMRRERETPARRESKGG